MEKHEYCPKCRLPTKHIINDAMEIKCLYCEKINYLKHKKEFEKWKYKKTKTDSQYLA